ncbi:amino acid adenylation domain-containing protein [Paenibacillus illinoisensis]|uniref:amino acid adenylation domain-containing protein n=1 Tax=Paenibacillus illinoisensis TaxID=59845 RepID=UPI00301994DA
MITICKEKELTENNDYHKLSAFPGTPIEKMIAEIWAEELGLETVSREDEFSSLGGNEQSAVHIITKVSSRLGFQLPQNMIEETGTVSQMSADTMEQILIRSSKQSISFPKTIEGFKTKQNVYPLSANQKRLWLLEQIDNLNAAYNIPAYLSITGKIDLDLLKKAFAEVIARHDMLRTKIIIKDDEPFQEICTEVSFEIEEIHLEQKEGVEREALINHYVKQESNCVFDLERAPLFRALLLCLNNDENVLLFTVHHIIADAWSINILYEEIFSIYAAHINGTNKKLKELTINYGDYVYWQAQTQKEESIQPQLTYWREQLGGVKGYINLYTDKTYPSQKNYQGKHNFIELPNSLVNRLHKLSSSEGATLYMVMLTAYQLLLYSHSGEEDIVIGTPSTNRNLPELESLVGFFVNTIPIRAKVGRTLTFRELLLKNRATVLEAFENQDVPFEKIVEIVNIERNMSRSPLIQVLFTMQKEQPINKFEGLNIKPVVFENDKAKFEITLSLTQSDEGINGYFEYNTDLFENRTINRMARDFIKLLEIIVESPTAPIEQILSSLTKENTLTTSLNDTYTNYEFEKCTHQLFEEQVERTPKSVAVKYEDSFLTYEELNTKSNQLARFLQKEGVAIESLVGICLERSLDMMVSLMGVHKSGAAYVGIDSKLPIERIKLIVKDSGTKIMLTHSHLAEKLEDMQDVQIVYLDDQWDVIAAEQTDNLNLSINENNLAQVIYTSGSTGVPKAILGEHRQIVNYIFGIRDKLPLDLNANYAMIQNLAVDAPVTFIYGALFTGGTLHIISEEYLRDYTAFSHYMTENQIDYLKIAPTLLKAMLASDEAKAILPSKFVMVGGEQSHWSLAKQVYSLSRNCRFINHYGPTETTCGVITYDVDFNELTHMDDDRGPLPIGRPLPNTKVYILNDNFTHVPMGRPGELYIGGEGVARGYLGNPALTAEKFVPDPFSSVQGSRLYKTGDLARINEEGVIEFLGRIDDQVKIRGHRIEINEIESVLNSYPLVNVSAVRTHTTESEELFLAAYMTASSKECDQNSIINYLRQRLPEYMMPSRFVFLDNFPRTPQGKIDKKKLVLPVEVQHTTSSGGEVEELLRNTWEDVLNINIKDNDVNFFDIGGHSLLATQLVSRIKKTFEIPFTVKEFFENATINKLAVKIGDSQKKSAGITPIHRLTSKQKDTLIPMSFVQQRMWLLYQFDPSNPVYNVPYAYRIHGKFSLEGLEHALNAVVKRHEVLRTVFHVKHGEAWQLILPELIVDVPVVNVEDYSGQQQINEIDQIMHKVAKQPFELEKGPLLRAVLIKIKSDEQIMMLNMHHIVSDRWSREIFMQELVTAYESYINNEEIELAELPIQYSDFAIWQRKYMQGEIFEHQLDYWVKQLADVPPVLQLPTDFPRPKHQNFKGKLVEFNLSIQSTDKLRTLSRNQNVTLYMILLAVFQTLLYRYSKQTDFCIGSPVANRVVSETEPLIGCFVNTLVMRSNVKGNPRFRELLTRVRSTALGAYNNQDIPFEKLVEVLQPERNLGHHPLFQVMLTFHNVPVNNKMKFSGVTIESLDFEDGIAKRDLTVRMEDTSNGLRGIFEYNTDLFSESTVQLMVEHFKFLLLVFSNDPDIRIDDIEMLTLEERESKDMDLDHQENNKKGKFKKIVKNREGRGNDIFSSSSLVDCMPLFRDSDLPLVIKARYKDVDLVEYLHKNKDFIEQTLMKHKGILFRNFLVENVEQFEKAALVLSPVLLNYTEQSTPRNLVGGKVYTSTEYPADQSISQHNEVAYSHNWPLKIWFYCEQPAQEGGATPIADSRKVFESLDNHVKARFIEKGVMYVRNYGDTFDLPWQTVFGTNDKHEVERYCENVGIDYEWKSDNGLRTRQVRQAVVKHPKTNELVWFNSAHMFHISSLDRNVSESLLKLFTEEELPRNSYYGDGTPIEPEVIKHIKDVYKKETLSFPWQKGDVMLLDNILASHGREPYKGARKVLVAMAEEYQG